MFREFAVFPFVPYSNLMQAIYQVVLGCSSPRSFTVENKYHPRRQLVRCEVNASFVS